MLKNLELIREYVIKKRIKKRKGRIGGIADQLKYKLMIDPLAGVAVNPRAILKHEKTHPGYLQALEKTFRGWKL